ncbi:hypothetical protein M9H77_09898 [Catharanthus roseus]|uniref:Uncharacterized protein n=1 Tax=Catharanthus roseus TaxID=4058 RepID=A0ACC0C2D8_CATRO|nr:hypothetical protein M9H77_09898 [Catharanthus roseus]
MDFLKKFASEATSGPDTTTTDAKPSSDHPTDRSQTELFASAQVVAEAARSAFQKDENKADNAKVAGAAADLLDAAEKYGKLDTSTGIGSYVEKAENYLHQYESSHSTTTAPPTKNPEETENKITPPPPVHTNAPPPPDVKTDAPAEETENKITTPPPPSAEKTEGGIGDYMKVAEGFLNKGSESKTEESGDSGSGLMKLAGDFLKK